MSFGGDGVGSGAFGAGVSTAAGVGAAAAMLTAASGEEAADATAANTAPGTYAEDSAGDIETPEEYERVGTGTASTTGATLGELLLPPSALASFAYSGPLTIGGLPGSAVSLPATFKDLMEAGSSILHVPQTEASWIWNNGQSSILPLGFVQVFTC